jgi:hypothetical protein
MSFAAKLIDFLGESSSRHDIRASVRSCFFFDFAGAPTYLWDGMGVLISNDGQRWLGTINGDGVNAHTKPALSDPRDGASPNYEFGLPFLDEASFNLLKADQDRVKGRTLTIYDVAVDEGEGLRPGTDLGFHQRLEMRAVLFDDGVAEVSPGEIVNTYSATVQCRSLESGRSRFPGGTYTDTSQRERARLLGVASDTGCSMIAGNADRPYVFD